MSHSIGFPSSALERAAEARLSLPDDERMDAETLLALWDRFLGAPAMDTTDLRREAARLVEVLARRSATAMPFAALGRALLAQIAGSETMSRQLLREFEEKLDLLGL